MRAEEDGEKCGCDACESLVPGLTTTEAVVSSARSTTVGDPARASVMCVRVAVSSPCSPNVSTASQSLLVPSPAVVLLPLPAAADF